VRAPLATQLLSAHCGDERLPALGALLNESLRVAIPTPAGITKLRKHHRDTAVAELFLALLKGVCDSIPLVVVIDNGFNMHPDSWALAHRVAAAACLPVEDPDALKLMLVIGTRPPVRYLDVVLREVPQGYTDLVSASWVSVHLLGRLSRERGGELVRQAVGKSSWKRLELDDAVGNYFEDKAKVCLEQGAVCCVQCAAVVWVCDGTNGTGSHVSCAFCPSCLLVHVRVLVVSTASVRRETRW